MSQCILINRPDLHTKVGWYLTHCIIIKLIIRVRFFSLFLRPTMKFKNDVIAESSGEVQGRWRLYDSAAGEHQPFRWRRLSLPFHTLLFLPKTATNSWINLRFALVVKKNITTFLKMSHLFHNQRFQMFLQLNNTENILLQYIKFMNHEPNCFYEMMAKWFLQSIICFQFFF